MSVSKKCTYIEYFEQKLEENNKIIEEARKCVKCIFISGFSYLKSHNPMHYVNTLIHP